MFHSLIKFNDQHRQSGIEVLAGTPPEDSTPAYYYEICLSNFSRLFFALRGEKQPAKNRKYHVAAGDIDLVRKPNEHQRIYASCE